MNRKYIYAPLLILLAVVAVYSKSCSSPFIFDDASNIVENPHIRNLLPPSNWLKTPPAANVAARPIVNLSLAINYSLGGLNPWGYHVFNIIIHILAALVLFGLIRRTLMSGSLNEKYRTRSTCLSFCASLIWAVHPVHTQSVTYVIQRAESLMGFFYLLAIYCAVCASASNRKWIWRLVSFLCCLLGMATKPVMATAPLAVLIYERAFLFKSFREAWKANKKFYILLMTSWIFLFGILQTAPKGIETTAGFSLTKLTPIQYALTQPGVILHYLRLCFWPWPLVLDYDWPVAETASEIIPALSVLAVLLLNVILLWRKHPKAFFIGVWFFLVLLPTSSFIPIADVAFEYRLYLALISPVLFVVFGIDMLLRKLPAKSQILIGLSLMVLISSIFMRLSFLRNMDYSSSMRIWQDTVSKQPKNPRAHNNLGLELVNRGKLDDALPYFKKAVGLNPYYIPAYSNLGAVMAKKGNLDEAVSFYEKALALLPSDVKVRHNLGVAYKKQGRLEDALKQLEAALKANPFEASSYVELGLVLSSLGRWTEAEQALNNAIKIDPLNSDALSSLGYVVASQGRLDEAIQYLERAVSINPLDKTAEENLKKIRVFIEGHEAIPQKPSN